MLFLAIFEKKSLMFRIWVLALKREKTFFEVCFYFLIDVYLVTIHATYGIGIYFYKNTVTFFLVVICCITYEYHF